VKIRTRFGWFSVFTVAVALAAAFPAAVSAQVPIYTTDSPPATPALADLPLRSSVTKDGVTWTFSQAVRVGQFVTGDYYVVGPVTVTSISPAPSPGRNGSVLNLPGCRPATSSKTAFDDRLESSGFYDASLRASLPVQMAPGDALTSSISVATVGTIKAVMRPTDNTISPVRTISVLTSVAAPMPPDTFRPSYCGRQSGFHYSRNLQRNRLPRLNPVQGTPTLSEFAGYLRRPWVDTLFFGFDAPIEYMPNYGREVGRVVGHAALLLTLNHAPADREALLVYFVQYGIDLFGIVSAGHPGWTGWGGHGSGRKLPILFAGALLNDSRFYSLKAAFGEDVQTIIATGPPNGPGWTGDTALYAGHMGVNGESTNPGWGPYEHLQPRNWRSAIGEDYRRCCTSIAWVGQALAARLVGVDSSWNHPAFFAYVERWMNDDDTAAVAAILSQTGRDYSASWQRQGQSWDAFVDAMWRAYSNAPPSSSLPSPPTNVRIVSP
jgi:hypothetical protein